MARAPRGPKDIVTLLHGEATRANIPTAELQAFADQLEAHQPSAPRRYPRARPLAAGETRERDEDLDPQIIWNGARIRLTEAQRAQLAETGEVEIGDAQLVWRGKDTQDWSDLVVATPPLYIQEKIHPKAIIDDLKRRSGKGAADDGPDLFADFSRLPKDEVTEFYQHPDNWSNRMILGDSLQVMASLAEREKLAGKVQCIYFDPPYGIKFNSNWQVSTQSRDVKDGKQTDLSREPEQVKAFRDTWKDGVHSYLTYLRDRLTAMRELLTESGSIFVQIGDENVHRVRAVMDEVFGDENVVSVICLQKTGGQETSGIPNVSDYIIWYARNKSTLKYRQLYFRKEVGVGQGSGARYDRLETVEGRRRPLNPQEKAGQAAIPLGARPFQLTSLISSGVRTNTTASWSFRGQSYHSGATSNWKTSLAGLDRLSKAERIDARTTTVAYVRYIGDFAAYPMSNIWTDVAGAAGIIYVVQTSTTIIQRCILMATDPGDLVLDPTCGSGTTAYVAEQWGRRWITFDTSRVALALARTRLMSARYPYYLLGDSPDPRDQLLQTLKAFERELALRDRRTVIDAMNRLAERLEGAIDFVAADNPHASPLTLHILAAVAEHERKMISERTRAALAAAKARGRRLGAYGEVLAASNKAAAMERLKPIAGQLRGMRADGMSVRGMATALNEAGVPSPAGGRWHIASIHAALKRLGLGGARAGVCQGT